MSNMCPTESTMTMTENDGNYRSSSGGAYTEAQSGRTVDTESKRGAIVIGRGRR